jgi:glutathione S-transferase
MPDAPDPDHDTAREQPTRSWKERTGTALRRRLAVLQEEPEAGMSTAEYAVGTVAACAFAAVLYRVVTGDSVVDGLTDLVDRALATLA